MNIIYLRERKIFIVSKYFLILYFFLFNLMRFTMKKYKQKKNSKFLQNVRDFYKNTLRERILSLNFHANNWMRNQNKCNEIIIIEISNDLLHH